MPVRRDPSRTRPSNPESQHRLPSKNRLPLVRTDPFCHFDVVLWKTEDSMWVSDRGKDHIDTEGDPQLGNHPVDLNRELRPELENLALAEVKEDT